VNRNKVSSSEVTGSMHHTSPSSEGNESPRMASGVIEHFNTVVLVMDLKIHSHPSTEYIRSMMYRMVKVTRVTDTAWLCMVYYSDMNYSYFVQ
jgi:hypothetical protein